MHHKHFSLHTQIDRLGRILQDPHSYVYCADSEFPVVQQSCSTVVLAIRTWGSHPAHDLLAFSTPGGQCPLSPGWLRFLPVQRVASTYSLHLQYSLHYSLQSLCMYINCWRQSRIDSLVLHDIQQPVLSLASLTNATATLFWFTQTKESHRTLNIHTP